MSGGDEAVDGVRQPVQGCARIDEMHPNRAVEDAAGRVDIGDGQFGTRLARGTEHAGRTAQRYCESDVEGGVVASENHW